MGEFSKTLVSLLHRNGISFWEIESRFMVGFCDSRASCGKDLLPFVQPNLWNIFRLAIQNTDPTTYLTVLIILDLLIHNYIHSSKSNSSALLLFLTSE